MAAKLVQIFYDEKQKAHLYPFAIPYFNETLTIFFENKPIVDVVSTTEADKIAVLSWKFKQKLRTYMGKPRELTLEVLNSDYDVLAMTKNLPTHHFMGSLERWHRGGLKTFDKMLGLVGISRPMELKNGIYQNAFSAKREIYQDYVKSYLIPCMDVIENNKDLNEEAMRDSGYSGLANEVATPQYLMSKIGVPYYPMSTFLLERLFSVYCHNHRIKITHL